MACYCCLCNYNKLISVSYESSFFRKRFKTHPQPHVYVNDLNNVFDRKSAPAAFWPPLPIRFIVWGVNSKSEKADMTILKKGSRCYQAPSHSQQRSKMPDAGRIRRQSATYDMNWRVRDAYAFSHVHLELTNQQTTCGS
jgi:hypothetical protein